MVGSNNTIKLVVLEEVVGSNNTIKLVVLEEVVRIDTTKRSSGTRSEKGWEPLV